MAVELLSTKLGISDILPQAQSVHLPGAEAFNQAGRAESLTEAAAYQEALAADGFSRAVAFAFQPKVSSDELLSPGVFNNLLLRAAEKLSSIKDADVRRFLREDLQPLAENRQLLQAYLGMMVEG